MDMFIKIEKIGCYFVAVFEGGVPQYDSEETIFRINLESLELRIANSTKYGLDNLQNLIAKDALLNAIKENKNE